MRLFRLGVVFGALMLAGNLRADVVVDSFGDSAGPLNPTPGNPASVTSTVSSNGYSRDFMASVGGDASMTTTIQDVSWIMDGGSTSGAFNSQLEYNGFSLNLSSSPYLQFNINTVFGNPLLYVQVQSSNGSEVTGAAQLNSSENGTSLTFDLRQLNGYTSGFLNGVNDILVGVGDNGSTAFTSFNEISFSSAPGDSQAVPEPSTIALIILAASLLLGIHLGRTFFARQ
jgi:hypothetical protein